MVGSLVFLFSEEVIDQGAEIIVDATWSTKVPTKGAKDSNENEALFFGASGNFVMITVSQPAIYLSSAIH